MSVSSTSPIDRWAAIGSPLALRSIPADWATISTSKPADSSVS
jgi:hypothetical protein